MFSDKDRLSFLLEAEACLFVPLSAYGAETEPGKYRTNYIGSKQKLLDWIWENTPDGVAEVVDAFSGSAVVSYMFKSKGLKVVSNDRLRFAYHTARAIIENTETKLDDEDISKLCQPNPQAGAFVQEHFKGVFYSDEVNAAIDLVRSNIDALTGYKRDIALAALARACLTAKGGFGHFTAVSNDMSGSKEGFFEDFAEAARKFGDLVFDNGKECRAHRKDVLEFLPAVDGDLAYFDPPYATEFSTTNYEKAYHFIEGLMSYWDGLTLQDGSKVKSFHTNHQTVTRANANAFFERFLGEARHIPGWIISYRDHSFPNEEQMTEIIRGLGRSSRMETKRHSYSITSKRGEASDAQERLFVCSKEAAKRAAAAGLHTVADAQVVEDSRGGRVVIEIRVL